MSSSFLQDESTTLLRTTLALGLLLQCLLLIPDVVDRDLLALSDESFSEEAEDLLARELFRLFHLPTHHNRLFFGSSLQSLTIRVAVFASHE
jgi:hypothetical protein